MRINPRILLLPFMALFEFSLLAVCWGFALVAPRLAMTINDWSKKLPELDWYI